MSVCKKERITLSKAISAVVLTNLEREVDNVSKYSSHCLIIEFVDGDNIKVPDKSRSDGVSASSWGAHGCHHLDVNQLQLAGVLLVIPAQRSLAH